jgi:HPr Serine kinase C-terminal domain
MGALLTTENWEGDEPPASERFDPYLQFVEMPLSAVFYPLGFPVRVTSNSAEILEAAEESWGGFQQTVDMPPIVIKFGVMEGGGRECPPTPVSRAQQNIMVRIADAANFYIVDLLQGFSFGWINSAAISHRSYVRYHFLEAAALSHIANRYTAPVHAACVDWQGRGVLLCGDSGAGKSSLAFACARAGWTYVADDASFLMHGERDRRVLGNCNMVRLRPSAAELFGEVARRPITLRATGKPSIEIPLATMPEIRRALSSDVENIVFLNRTGSRLQELSPFPIEVARSYVHKHLCGMEDLREAQMASVERLLTARIFELRYCDLDWAVERLERLMLEQ